MKKPYHPLPEEYRAIWEKREYFSLCIVGKDPYPSNPIGIPFCKPSWDQFDFRTSGRYVLRSLGIDPEHPPTGDPRSVFVQLATEGIGFLNATYWFLGRSFAKGLHQELVLKDSLVNLPYLKKSRRILLCGEAGKLPWLLKDAPLQADVRKDLMDVLARGEHVPHPDVRNRSHPERGKIWQLYWANDVLRGYREQ